MRFKCWFEGQPKSEADETYGVDQHEAAEEFVEEHIHCETDTEFCKKFNTYGMDAFFIVYVAGPEPKNKPDKIVVHTYFERSNNSMDFTWWKKHHEKESSITPYIPKPIE